jgi:hypothetical protein
MYSRLSNRIIIGPSVPLYQRLRHVSCYVRLMFLKTSHKWNTKYPFKTVYFLGVRGLTASSYVGYEYATGGHTDV